MQPKLAFLTTVNHNVGDDFIREGIVYFVKRIIGSFDSVCIHKHEPVRPGPHIFKLWGLSHIWKNMRREYVSNYFDQILNADIIIQAGAPVYWLNKYHNSSLAEWVTPFWYERISKVYKDIPVLNIAAGSCIADDRSCEDMLKHKKLKKFIRDIHAFCRITTVRDVVAHDLLKELNLSSVLLPCTSLFARESLNIHNDDEKYFVINYMPLGGHYLYDQKRYINIWKKKVREVSKLAQKKFMVKWVCHNKNEYMQAQMMNVDNKDIFYSDDYKDYIAFYGQCVGGLLNRIHGAMMIGSYGRKSLVVGIDSRLKMADLVGIPNMVLSEIEHLSAREIMDTILSNRDTFKNEIKKLIQNAKKQYLQIFENYLTSVTNEKK
ncbi:MAG: polysaccharide pyruvyl transferase family protein [Candidatus Omnitrophica bacterium]|nr:polysaccharide pyruvyl transferase family protein [Candidatus Omnitrophota bacterium]